MENTEHAACGCRSQRASAVGDHLMMPLTWLRLLLLVPLMLVAAPSSGLAQARVSDLTQMSIEDLLNIEITSASRKEQRVADVAAAVFVITHDDIRRSGMTTIPDLLRLAPGVDVAQINSNKWAVSMRGFNGLYANKLLVLVDGRSLYNRIFSGVLWDAEDLLLDDIDRIEVIRGPGAAMWGANAVNGVINIVTKTTADTQGGLVRVDAGQFGEQGAARYGGTFGATRYRLYTQWTGRNQSLIAPGTSANDASHSITTGFRADWTPQAGALSLSGAFTTGEARALWPNLNPRTAAREPLANVPSDSQGGHLVARWTHTRPGGASLQIQSFVDIADRQEPVGNYDREIFDVDTQYHTALGARQDLVFGAGYRHSSDRFRGGVGFSMTPAEDNASLVTAFIQDEIAFFGARLAVTLGSQVQYDSFSGAGVQPTARVIWKGLPRQRLWAATSRALRTPSLYERGIRVDRLPVATASGLPLVASGLGNPAVETENLVDAEVGYRFEIGTAASIDVTGFVGRYDHLRTDEPGAPVVQFVPSPQIAVTSQFGNRLEATTRGLEVAGHWAPVQPWRLDGSYTAFGLTPRLAAASHDPAAATEDGSAPRTQWQVRSAYSPGTRATFNVALFHVGSIERLQVAAYTRADISAEWRFTSRLSAMAIGQNLFDAAHAEFGGVGSFLRVTQVPRSANLRLRWTFR
jgi:iron complex outermembrane recepter protein